jgi:hypothetical protein
VPACKEDGNTIIDRVVIRHPLQELFCLSVALLSATRSH